MSIPLPEPKELTVNVPLRDGVFDFTEYTGRVFYEERKGVAFEFVAYDSNFYEFEDLVTELARDIHGKKVKVVVDNAPNLYLMCRLSIDTQKTTKALSRIVLKGTAEPYRYNMTASNEPWYWDTFSFINGVITSLGELTLNNETKTLVIPKGYMPVSPSFVCRNVATLTVSDGTHIRNLANGSQRFGNIVVNGDDEITLTFIGTGNVSVVYRGGSL